jgi:K(+)-stimulated pyrophosphate-energized sodium pump
MGSDLMYYIPVMGLVGLAVMIGKAFWVNKQDAGDANMQELAGYIANGASAFLKAEWKVLGVFAVIAAALLAWSGACMPQQRLGHRHRLPDRCVLQRLCRLDRHEHRHQGQRAHHTGCAYELVTSTQSELHRRNRDGFRCCGSGRCGSQLLFIVFLACTWAMLVQPNGTEAMMKCLEVLAGFSLGAESIALFARVGGGIYTKAADVGADLVGKVEAGIPEDDARNPATIADNVGDNVGDVAGMGADLFGSYVATMLATMVLGREVVSADNFGGMAPILLPMVIAGLGVLFSIIGTFFVRINKDSDSVMNALNLGNWGSMVLVAISSYFLVDWMLPETMQFVRNGVSKEITSMNVFYAIMLGLVVGTLMSMVTEYYTSMGRRPVDSIVQKSGTGHGTNVIGGLAMGMESTVLPILILAAGIWGSFTLAGMYGVAIAAAGMMATTAMQLAIDAFGPIADNAGGIAEMSGLPKEVRERTDNLDAVGNTTAATGKGFAIASAALTALALFAAYVGMSGITGIDIYKADVLAMLFVGGMIPFFFSSLAISAVGKAAMDMVKEVRRQFREIPGIMEGKAKPEYEKCVAISTEASIREMIAPGALALISPILVGFLVGPEALGGLLAGITVSGVLMGMFQNNAGGAWDNAKKSFEKGVDIDGTMYYKHKADKPSAPHQAAVTGDTVGDPFKDTSGPSMNILIKLTSIVALIIAPHLQDGASHTVEVPLPEVPEMKAEVIATPVAATVTGFVKSLPSGFEVKGDTAGIERGLIAFIEGPAPVDKTSWFNFDRVTFKTGSAAIDMGKSNEQLVNLSEILTAYPGTKLKIGGYTDNTGDEAANMKLSADRANAVRNALMLMGVDGARLEAEGYGSQHPVADNATDEGRAKNRRIAVRVSAK